MRLAAGPKSSNLYNHISFITFKNITGRNVTNFNINTSILITKSLELNSFQGLCPLDPHTDKGIIFYFYKAEVSNGITAGFKSSNLWNCFASLLKVFFLRLHISLQKSIESRSFLGLRPLNPFRSLPELCRWPTLIRPWVCR